MSVDRPERRVRCGFCERLAREVSVKFKVPYDEALEAMEDLISEDPNLVEEAKRKIESWGAKDYVKKRSREMRQLLGDVKVILQTPR